MSWNDRDYARGRSGPASIAGLPVASVTTWLVLINVAVFLVDRFFAMQFDELPIEEFGHFSAALAIQHLQLWRFLTFQFLHANLGHLFMNMLALYFFGQAIELYLGHRRFLAFYLLCGIAGAALYLILWQVHLLVSGPTVRLVGASAGIFGVLIAAAHIAPNVQVMLLFPPIPMRLRTLAWALLGIAAFTVLTQGRNAGGEAAHLGGAIVGAMLIRWPNLLNPFELRLPWRASRGASDPWRQFRR